MIPGPALISGKTQSAALKVACPLMGGMLEYWKAGMMGSIRKKALGFRINLLLSSHEPNISSFHCSILPNRTVKVEL